MKQKSIKEKLDNINFVLLTTIVLIFLGILFRLKFYLEANPLWLDELYLANNLIEGNFFDLFKPLLYYQVAPPFFTVCSKFLLSFTLPFHNATLSDLSLRFLPCLCSILSLPLFAILVHQMFKNGYMTLVCTTLLSLNPLAILQATQFKQYSVEMFFTIILTLIFFSINIKTISIKKLSLYSLLFCISTWFSASAWFVLFGGFLFLAIDILKNKYFNKLKTAVLLFPILINFIIFYFLYYVPITQRSYMFMYEYWKNQLPSFFSTTTFFTLFADKMQKVIYFPSTNLFYLFLIFNLLIFCYPKNNSKWINFKINVLILTPIVITIILSFLSKYPFAPRLILFLLPLFIIIYAQFVFLLKQNKITGLILIMTSLYCGIFLLNGKRNHFVKTDDNSRKIAELYAQKASPSDKLFLPYSTNLNYYFHVLGIKYHPALIFSPWHSIEEKAFIGEFNKLPSGHYWIYNYVEHTAVPKRLKQWIVARKDVQTLWDWTSPVNDRFYLIKFQKLTH